MRAQARQLPLPCYDHSTSYRIAAFRGRIGAYFTVFDRGHGDVDVDAVHQRSADLRAVADDHLRRATAFLFGIAVVAAGA